MESFDRYMTSSLQVINDHQCLNNLEQGICTKAFDNHYSGSNNLGRPVLLYQTPRQILI
jgi:hypothetical protein